MLELLRRHLSELRRALRLEVERVKADVPRVVVGLKRAERAVGQLERDLARRRRRRRDPAVECAVELGAADREGEQLEERRVDRAHLVEVADRRADVLLGLDKEEVRALLRDEANRREHRDAPVRHLGLAQHLHLVDGLALAQAGRVKERDGLVASIA